MAESRTTRPSDLSHGLTLDNEAGVSVKVYRVTEGGGREYLGLLSQGDTERFGSVQVGDELQFVPNDPAQSIDAFDVDDLSVVHEVRVLDPTVREIDEGKGPYRRLRNLTPSLFSYDVTRIDPFYLDNPAAMKKQLFRSLEPSDRRYDVVGAGTLVVPEGFDYVLLDMGWGGQETTFHSSTDSLLRTVYGGGSVGFTTPGTPDNKIGGKVSFDYAGSTSSSSTQTHAYSLSRRDVRRYRVDATIRSDGRRNPRLSHEFLDALRRLPTTGGDDAYDRFVADWGTHFPATMTYGGYFMGIRTMTSTQLQQLSTQKLDVAAEAAVPTEAGTVDVSGKGGFHDIDSSSTLDRFSAKRYRYRGGKGGPDGWRPGDAAAPVGLTLAPLSDVMVPEVVGDDVMARADLAARRTLMDRAIAREMARSPEWSTRTLKPVRRYEVRWDSLHVDSRQAAGSQGTYGYISCQPVGPGFDGPAVRVWDRSAAPGSRIDISAGRSLTGGRSFTFDVPADEDGRYPTAGRKVRLAMRICGHVNIGDNFLFGERGDHVALADFTRSEQRRTYQVKTGRNAATAVWTTSCPNLDFSDLFEN